MANYQNHQFGAYLLVEFDRPRVGFANVYLGKAYLLLGTYAAIKVIKTL